MAQIIPQSLKTADKGALDGRYKFDTLEAATEEAYDGAIFYIASLAEWYKFKKNDQNVLVAIADSAIDASQFALKSDLSGLATSAVASASSSGLMSAANYVKLRDIDPTRITKVAASTINGNIRINDTETNVFTRPNTESDRPVSDTEKTSWNGKADSGHVHSNYSLNTHNHNTEYAVINHEHQVWDDVLGHYREKYVLADSQGSGGNATSLGGLGLNDNATGETGNNAIYSATKILSIVAAKIGEFATGFTWKPAVNNFAAIATAYPTPVDGWTTITKDTDKTWRYDGSAWVDISSSTIPLVTQSVDGKMSAADKAKLDGIAAGATNYVHPSNHAASMITEETDKRFMTDAERTFISDRNKTFSGTYAKLPSDYAAGKPTVEVFSGVNLGLGTTGSYASGVLETYVTPDRSLSRQVFSCASGLLVHRFTNNNVWGGWLSYYSQQNMSTATTSNQGFMSAADKTKVDGIAAGATATPLSSVNPSALGVAAVGTGTSAARADHVHALPAAATTSVDGLMSAADKTKLNAIASSATNTPLGSATPSAVGVAAVGVATNAAREDHVHPLPASPTVTGTFTAAKLVGRKIPAIQTVTSAASVTIDCDNNDAVKITAQAAALTFAAPSGTPSDMQMIAIRLKDNGTARAITWNAAFVAMGVALPSTTIAGKTMNIVIMYDSVVSKWGIVSLAKEA